MSSNAVDVGGRRLTATDIVVATGSRTAVPPVEGLTETGFLDHVSFLAQDTFPKSIAILGGGYIGCEFAKLFRRFGSDVTIVEMADEIIGREDRDVIAFIRRLLEEEGITIRRSLADAVQKAASKYNENLNAGRLGALAKRVAAWTQWSFS